MCTVLFFLASWPAAGDEVALAAHASTAGVVLVLTWVRDAGDLRCTQVSRSWSLVSYRMSEPEDTPPRASHAWVKRYERTVSGSGIFTPHARFIFLIFPHQDFFPGVWTLTCQISQLFRDVRGVLYLYVTVLAAWLVIGCIEWELYIPCGSITDRTRARIKFRYSCVYDRPKQN